MPMQSGRVNDKPLSPAERVLARWYDEMWSKKQPELVHELIGETYTRHEFGETRVVSTQEYYEQVKSVMENADVSGIQYSCFSEEDKVCVVGSWNFDGKEWSWVQVFRVENDRLVETWFSGIAADAEIGEGWTSSGAYDSLR